MLNLIAPLLGKLASGTVKTAVMRTRNQAISWALVGVALFFALIFLMLIIYIWLLTWFSPMIVATILFVFWLILSAILSIIARVVLKKKEDDHQAKINEEQNSVLIATALAALPLLTKNKKLLVVGVPLMAALTMLLQKINSQDER